MANIGKLEKTKFFNELALAMNIVDINVAKTAYYGLVKYITKNALEHRKTRLIDFGTFRVAPIIARMSNMPYGVSKKWVGESCTLKFKAHYKLKDFLNKKEYGIRDDINYDID